MHAKGYGTNVFNTDISKPFDLEKILEVQKLLILELYENYDKTKNAIDQWEKFINKKIFYEHKVYGGCLCRYDEEWLEYNLKNDLMVNRFEQEKIVLENLNESLEKILKDNTSKE